MQLDLERERERLQGPMAHQFEFLGGMMMRREGGVPPQGRRRQLQDTGITPDGVNILSASLSHPRPAIRTDDSWVGWEIAPTTAYT